MFVYMRCQFVPEAPPTGIVDDDAVRESIGSLVRSVGLRTAETRIPIIFATASGNGHKGKEARDHGAAAFLDKPFGDETFLNAMRLALAQ